MILSRNYVFSSAQAITATATSTNNIDTGTHGTVYGGSTPLPRDFGKGTDIPFVIQVAENFNNLTSLTAAIRVANNAAMTGAVTVWSFTELLANLKVGYSFPIDSLQIGTNNQYIDIQYTVAGTAPTTGKINAFIPAGVQTSPLN